MQLFYDVKSKDTFVRFTTKDEAYQFASALQEEQNDPVLIQAVLTSDDFIDSTVVDEDRLIK